MNSTVGRASSYKTKAIKASIDKTPHGSESELKNNKPKTIPSKKNKIKNKPDIILNFLIVKNYL